MSATLSVGVSHSRATAAGSTEPAYSTAKQLIRRIVPYLFVVVYPSLGVLAVVANAHLGILAVYAAATGTALLAQRLIPFIPVAEYSRWRRRLTDLTYLVTSVPLFYLLQTALVPLVTHLRDTVFGSHTLWIGAMPIGVQAVVAFLGMDFAYYWTHRMSHGDNVFWRLHRVHHSSQNLDWLMNWRIHWLSEILNLAVRFVPLILIGVPTKVVAIAMMIDSARSIFPHVNADVVSGPLLNRVINTPEIHRWHHIRDPKLAAANYGLSTVLWDHAFGTYKRPGVTRSAVFGVPDSEAIPESWWGQLLSPWRKQVSRPTVRTALQTPF